MTDEHERDPADEAGEAPSEPAAEDAPSSVEVGQSLPETTAEGQVEGPAGGAPRADGEPADAQAEAPVEAAVEAADQRSEDKEAPEDDLEVSFEIADAGPCRKKISVTVTREVFDKEMDKELTELSQSVVTPGFRKGRAPRRIIERRYGRALADQLKRSLAARGMQKSITEADLVPLGEPDIGDIEMAEDGPLTVNATMDVRPTLDLKDYTGLQVTKRAVSVGEKEIDRALSLVLERRGRLVPVADPEATVEEKDLVVCDYRLTADEKVLVERSDITIPMQLRALPDIPELGTDRLLGAKAQATVETTFELSDEKWPEDVRGQRAALSVTLHEIKRLELPELTDELLEELGVESEEDLRGRIEMMLLRDLEREVQRDVQGQVERQLLEQADFELPESLVAEQAARSAEQARLKMMELGIGRDEIDEGAENLAGVSRERAQRDLKLHFILDHIAERESIAAEALDVEERMVKIAARYGISPRQARLWLEKDGTLDSMRMMIREQKTTDWLVEHAEITEQEPEVDAEVVAPEGT